MVFLDACQMEGLELHAFFAVVMATGLRLDERRNTRSPPQHLVAGSTLSGGIWYPWADSNGRHTV